MKKLIISLTAIIALIFLFYIGLHMFGKFIYNTQSCELYNIDNIELRTGVNIPKVTSIECECKDNKKLSKFIIDTQKVDLDDYVLRNEFVLVDKLYIKENENKNSKYKVIFDKNKAELEVNITYKSN